MKTTIDTTNSNYPQPAAELIDEIRTRLSEVSQDVLERAHHAFMHSPIQEPGSILWRAGVCLSSHELYEYRKTLFPPNSLVDPDTQGPPVLRSASSSSSNSEHDRSADSLSTSPSSPDLHPPSSGAILLTDLRDVINRYVVLPEMAAEALALWVVHTYAFQIRQVTTYIGVVSPEKRCGKTTLLELLALLANRSLTAANISPSALFRVIEETKPTLLIDEADTFLQGRDELAGILNAGYRKGNAYVVRVAEGKVWRKEERTPEFGEWTQDRVSDFAKYSCWCPKVMAAIGRLPDTLADRCIIITMQRKMAGEKCERMRHLNAEEYRKRCDEFVQLHSQAIANARPEIPSSLNDRAADIWEPLLAIADLAGGEWPELARKAAQQLSASEDEMTLLGYFLKDLRNLMILKKVDRMLSRDVVTVFNPMHRRPWEDLRRGREINEWWLGRKMNELGIRSRYLRIDDTVARGYLLQDIDAAFRRYIPNAETHIQHPPSETSNAKS